MRVRAAASILFSIVLIVLTFTGCTEQTAQLKTNYSFASMFFNTTDTAHCFRSLENQTTILDYETMETSSLCNKPNCKHDKDDCINHRLNGNIPMFSGTDAYYFVDTGGYIKEGEDGKPYLELGSTLYHFDLTTNTEEKLFHIDGVSVSKNCYGWLLNGETIYFIGNHYNAVYDETGLICGYGNSGGEMELYSLDLSNLTIQNYGDLYNINKLSEMYPYAKNSSEVYMKGLFDNKIYFEVCFVPTSDSDTNYVEYVTWFDLDEKTYHGEPQDYSSIDYCTADFVTKDYLVLTRKNQADVYKAGQKEPVILKDASFQPCSLLSVFDDTLYYYDGKAFDLMNGKVMILKDMCNKQVIAKYGDSYIISDIGMQANFEKIPVSQLLGE